MHRKRLFIYLMLLGVVLAGCAPQATPPPTEVPTEEPTEIPPTAIPPTEVPPEPTEIPPTTLAAIHISEPPVLDGRADDAIWDEAPAMVLTTPSLTLKAAYTDTDLYLLAVLPDSTASFTRGGAWEWDGTEWTTTSGQSEDRLAIMWDMETPNFETQGCMTKCHPGTNAEGGEDDAWLETGKADMWHMKAARVLPAISISQTGELSIDEVTHEVTGGSIAFNGWADDKWIGQWSADNAPDGGRYGDPGGSSYGRNRNEDKTGPQYIETAPADFVDGMVLYQTEIDNGEAVEVASLSEDQLQAAWDTYAVLGAAVPERILRDPEGSRADVFQSAVWENGTWTLEFQRALDTGHPEDDAIIDDLSLPYLFGVAYMDNTDGSEHIPSGVLTLVFLP